MVWLTGLSGAGKTTIALHAFNQLSERGVAVEVLDGDDIRQKQNKHLGFSREDRDRNVMSIAAVANERARQGFVVLVAVISPYLETRQSVRKLCDRYMEVFVDAPLAVCEERDPKGLYRRARNGETEHFTGIDSPYEEPAAAEVHCLTDIEKPEVSALLVVKTITEFMSSGGRRKTPSPTGRHRSTEDARRLVTASFLAVHPCEDLPQFE